MARSRAGYSLAELIVVMAITAVMAAMVIPRFSYGLVSRKKADTTATKLMTDLRRTRSMAVRDAATNSKGFELDLSGSSPYPGYTIENADSRQVVDTVSFVSGVTVTCQGSSKFTFEPLGNLKTGSGTQIAVVGDGKSFTLTFVSATGMVKLTRN